jgi:hypothetical protein
MTVSGDLRGLGAEVFDFVVNLLERDPPEVSGAVLVEAFPEVGQRLIDCGALRPIANATIVTCRACDADHPADVEFDASVSGYRHFCPEAGWVGVPAEDLKRYRADLLWLLAELRRGLEISDRMPPSCLVEGVLWDLGEAWLGKRKATVLFGRRLSQSENLDQAWDALTNRVGLPPGVLLTTSIGLARHSDVPGRHRIAPLKDCLKPAAVGIAIDLDILAGIVGGERPLHPDLPIHPSADFRVVRVGDRMFHFGGDKHRQVIEYLYMRWRDGEERVSTAAMFEDLEFPAKTRLRDLFKDHRNWKDLIGYGDGACWLKV